MPTHQGQTQTDITIGDGGDSAQQQSAFSFAATYVEVGNLQFRDLDPSHGRQSAVYEFKVNTPGGITIASFSARYDAWIERREPGGRRVVEITNSFDPAPNGDQPGLIRSPRTSAERLWEVPTFTADGNPFATLWVHWQLRTAVGSRAVRVVQTVTDQSADLLRVVLVFLDDDDTLLSVVATMPASFAVDGGVLADPPNVTDRFVPAIA